jgi:hypothetical protein
VVRPAAVCPAFPASDRHKAKAPGLPRRRAAPRRAALPVAPVRRSSPGCAAESGRVGICRLQPGQKRYSEKRRACAAAFTRPSPKTRPPGSSRLTLRDHWWSDHPATPAEGPRRAAPCQAKSVKAPGTPSAIGVAIVKGIVFWVLPPWPSSQGERPRGAKPKTRKTFI